jgi:hypothetical protein
MTKPDKQAEAIADLQRQIDELKGPPKSTFVPKTDAEWFDEMHGIAERRMSMATPPSVARYFADGVTAADCADINRASHAPTGPSSQGIIPSSQQLTGVRTGATPGWVDPRPLGPQPGIDLIDKGVNAALPHGPEWGKEKK